MSPSAGPAIHDKWHSSEENTAAKLIEIRGYRDQNLKQLMAEVAKRGLFVYEIDKNNVDQVACVLLKDDIARNKRITSMCDDTNDPSGAKRHEEQERQMRISLYLASEYNIKKMEIHLSYVDEYRKRNMKELENMANEVYDANVLHETRMEAFLMDANMSEQKKDAARFSLKQAMKDSADNFTKQVYSWDKNHHSWNESTHKYLTKLGPYDSEGLYVPRKKRTIQNMVSGDRKDRDFQTLVTTTTEHSNIPSGGPPPNPETNPALPVVELRQALKKNTKATPDITSTEKSNVAAQKFTVDAPTQSLSASNCAEISASSVKVGGSADTAIDLTEESTPDREDCSRRTHSLPKAPSTVAFHSNAPVRGEKSADRTCAVNDEAIPNEEAFTPDAPHSSAAPRSSTATQQSSFQKRKHPLSTANPAPKKQKKQSATSYIANRPYIAIARKEVSKPLTSASDKSLKQLKDMVKGEMEVSEIIRDNRGWYIVYNNTAAGVQAMRRCKFGVGFDWNGYVQADLQLVPPQ